MKKFFVILFILGITTLFGCQQEFMADNSPEPDPGADLARAGIVYEVYVTKPENGGNDANPGTEESPKATIQAAIDQAVASGSTASDIHVAAGYYEESITMAQGIHLFGGYNPSDWNDRNTEDRFYSLYSTWIYNMNSDTVVTVPPGATNGQIDGFYITSSYGLPFTVTRAYFELSNTSVIAANGETKAVYVRGAVLVVNTCLILGGHTHPSIGIKTEMDSTLSVLNSEIGGGHTGTSTAIDLTDTTAVFLGNRLFGGNGENTKAININETSPYGKKFITIENNIDIYGGAATNSACAISNIKSILTVCNNERIVGGIQAYMATGIYSNNALTYIHDNPYILAAENAEYGCGIQVQYAAAGEIKANKVIGSGSVTYATAIKTESSVISIFNNHITGGATGTGTVTKGLINDHSDNLVYNNVIDGGKASDTSYAVINVSASPRLYNNTITGGDGQNNAYCIMNVNGSAPEIINNILFQRDDDPAIYKFGISNSIDSIPYVSRNDFSIMKDRGMKYVGFKNNIADIPLISLWDMRLLPGTPVSISQGAVALTKIFNFDKNNTVRTNRWSMGAYELD